MPSTNTLLLVLLILLQAGVARAAPPQGLGQDEMRDFCHLSEGADIYPYEWMAALKSATYKSPETKAGLPFLVDLDRRFGMTRGPRASGYLVPWVGLTAAWSDAPPEEADAREFDRAERARTFEGKRSIKMGYRARHLSGIWATGPFLHHGSVPSVAALIGLEPRPERFLVKSHGLDPVALGFRSSPAAGEPVEDEEYFDTRAVGNSNQGHQFGQKLTADEKRAILEYLKVLPPEPEMAAE